MAENTAMRNNALPYPVYGVSYVLVLPILDADGDPVVGAANLDSEISLNGDTMADGGTEAEVGNGMYSIALTDTNMSADIVSGVLKTSTAGAKDTPFVLYPRKLLPLRSGTAQGGASAFITLDASAGTLNDKWNGCLCVATIDGNKEARIIIDYNGSNEEATVSPDWNVIPDSDDTFIIYLPEGIQIPDTDAIAKIVWDRVLSGATHNIPASAGRRLRGVQEFQGYEDGAVWIDIANGTSGTTPYENGVVGTPVNNMADANAIATAVNLSRFRIAPNSTITLAAAQENQVFIGQRWTLALNNKSVSGSMFSGADVSGIGTGAAEIRFEHCHFGAVTLDPSDMERCVLEGTFTIGRAGDFFFENCSSGVAGASTPVLDYGSGLGASDVNMRGYFGGIEIENMGANAGTYNLSFDCPAGQIIFNINCSATSIIELRGNHRKTNNATGLTINDDARIDVGQIAVPSAAAVADAVLDELVAAHVIAGSLSATIAALTPNADITIDITDISVGD